MITFNRLRELFPFEQRRIMDELKEEFAIYNIQVESRERKCREYLFKQVRKYGKST